MTLVLIPMHFHTEDAICGGVLLGNRAEVTAPRRGTEIRDVAPWVAASEFAHSCDWSVSELNFWLATLATNSFKVLRLNIEVFNRCASQMSAAQNGAQQRRAGALTEAMAKNERVSTLEA